MTARPCAACGATPAANSLGGVLVCAACRPILLERVEAARAAGKPADASKEALAMLRESGTTYLLRDIPADLWLQAKHQAIDQGISLRELILAALRAHIAPP